MICHHNITSMDLTKRCRVCGDQKAKSFNYNGQISCPSCRVFFHRNAFKADKLKCLKGGSCVIDIVSRKSCPKCRLSICLSVGMQAEMIQHTKTLNKKNIKHLEKSPSPPSVTKQSADIKIELQLKDILTEDNSAINLTLKPPKIATPLNPSRDPFELNPYELETMAEIEKASSVFEEESSLNIAGEAYGIIYISRTVTAYSRRTVKYCKSIQTFKELPNNDQLIQLKTFLYDIMVIRGAFQYNPVKDIFTMLESDTGKNAIIVTRKGDYEFKNRDLVEQNRTIFTELHAVLDGDRKIRNILTAISLVKPMPDLQCPEVVRLQYFKWCHLLYRYLARKHQSFAIANRICQRLMTIMQRDFPLTKENIRAILREFGVNQVAELIVETLNLRE